MRQFPFCGGCGCVRSVCICESGGETVSNEDRPAEIIQTDGGWRLTLIRTFETIAQAAAVIEAAESAEWGDDVRVELTKPRATPITQWRVGARYRQRVGGWAVVTSTTGYKRHNGFAQPIEGVDDSGGFCTWCADGSFHRPGNEAASDLLPGEITESGDVTLPPTVRGPAE
jgi:hypothetical protein